MLSRSNTETWRTDRQRELLYRYRASVCWRAIKIVKYVRCKTFMRIRYHIIYLIYLDRRSRLATATFFASVAKRLAAVIILESVPCVMDARAMLVRFITCPVTIRWWVTVIPCITRSISWHFVQSEPVTTWLEPHFWSVPTVPVHRSVYNVLHHKKFTWLKSAKIRLHITPNFITIMVMMMIMMMMMMMMIMMMKLECM